MDIGIRYGIIKILNDLSILDMQGEYLTGHNIMIIIFLMLINLNILLLKTAPVKILFTMIK